MSAEKTAKMLLTVFISLSVIGASLWYVSDKKRFDFYEVFTKAPLHGLSVSAAVEMLGIDVGYVEAIELITPKLARIVIAVKKNTPFSADITAKIVAEKPANKRHPGAMVVELLLAKDKANTYAPRFKTQYPIIPILPS